VNAYFVPAVVEPGPKWLHEELCWQVVSLVDARQPDERGGHRLVQGMDVAPAAGCGWHWHYCHGLGHPSDPRNVPVTTLKSSLLSYVVNVHVNVGIMLFYYVRWIRQMRNLLSSCTSRFHPLRWVCFGASLCFSLWYAVS
jgi:hypothetical protein